MYNDFPKRSVYLSSSLSDRDVYCSVFQCSGWGEFFQVIWEGFQVVVVGKQEEKGEKGKTGRKGIKKIKKIKRKKRRNRWREKKMKKWEVFQDQWWEVFQDQWNNMHP